MTGLDSFNDKIIEIAVIITNGHLEPVDEGMEYIIKTDKDILDKYVGIPFFLHADQPNSSVWARRYGAETDDDSMNEWCINQHGKSGLTAACLSSSHTHDEVERLVTEYIQRWIPEKGAGLLAGSTVHADMRYVPLLFWVVTSLSG